MTFTQARAKASILKALGHPVRVQMIDALSRGDQCVNELHRLSPICQANVSRHLAWLKRTGIVTERRVGPRVIHHLACPCILQALECTEPVIRKITQRRPADS